MDRRLIAIILCSFFVNADTISSVGNQTKSIEHEFIYEKDEKNDLNLQDYALRASTGNDIQATPITDVGIAAEIKANETHIYTLNVSQQPVHANLSLSECSRSNLNQKPLNLMVNGFHNNTSDGGFLQVDANIIGDNLIEITSPETDDPNATWSYELGIDESASYSFPYEALFFVDSDFANALFVTSALKYFRYLAFGTPYQSLINSSAPLDSTELFSLFLRPHDQNFPLSKSYCGVQNYAIINQNNANYSVSNRLDDNDERPSKGQFLINGLNRSASYDIHLGIPSTHGYIGGALFDPVIFSTKQEDSCQLIYNMTNCPEIAFSVPGNASAFTRERLTEVYDNYVGVFLQNFTQALDQVNCDDSLQNMFSIFSTCQMCSQAYTNWACTVNVPRCEDWSNNASYLIPREVNNSRNDLINEIIQPGKYKEILPCYWLCYNVATYCPSLFNFLCPSGEYLNLTYGFPSDNGDVSCSYPGAVYKRANSGVSLRPILWMILMSIMVSFI